MITKIISTSIIYLIISASLLFANSFWWLPEYPSLLREVDKADKHTLTTSYKTGPHGRSKVILKLFKKPNEGLILKTILPKESIFTVNPQTGEKEPSKTKPIITIRDHNMDGSPDDFKMEPEGMPMYKEEMTKDGFIKYREGQEHQAILMKWVIGIGYSVNHFLHGIDSTFPR